MNGKKYLICKGKAGLGNRLLSAAGSLLYAQATGRTLYIDWSDKGYSQDRVNSWPRFFQRPAMSESFDDAVLAADSVAPALWRGHLRDSVDDLLLQNDDHERDQDPRVAGRYTIDFSRADYPEDVLVRWSYTDEVFRIRPHLSGELGHLRALRDEDLLRTVMRDNLVLSAPLQQRVEDFRKERFGNTTIGLHIRYSDRKNSFEQYPVITDRILRQKPDAVIFLATDNQDVESYFRRRYRRVVTTKKWYPPAGTPLHRVRDCPDKTEMGASALVDMFLLSSCDYLVYNKTTTFGLCANLLSAAPADQRFETSPLRATAMQMLRWVRRKVSLGLQGGR